jgi:pimeloyl-ACP methyl ester carboxylesterase
MIDLSTIRYPAFDKPGIGRLLFYPRRESGGLPCGDYERLSIPVGKAILVDARFYEADQRAPTILFFHGNGEIVADYDDVGAIYRRMGINYLPVDYRGYGLSTGTPTVTTVMRDALVSFEFVTGWLAGHGFTGPLVVMGRSLGCAPALEVAFHFEARMAGLIIESGFGHILPLLKLMGIDDPELTEETGPNNLEKIRHVKKPTLVIHARYDQIIPISEGKGLYHASVAPEKFFLEIPGADHNDIFLRGMQIYLKTIDTFMGITTRKTK